MGSLENWNDSYTKIQINAANDGCRKFFADMGHLADAELEFKQFDGKDWQIVANNDARKDLV